MAAEEGMVGVVGAVEDEPQPRSRRSEVRAMKERGMGRPPWS
jgi:hypothetical protein